MIKVGDKIMWMCPLDADYSYGKVLGFERNMAYIAGIGLYKGRLAKVHLKHIKKLEKGAKRLGGGKKHCKCSAVKTKLQRS